MREGEADMLRRFAWLVAAQRRQRRAAELSCGGGGKTERKKCSTVISGLYRATVSATALEDARRRAGGPGAREKGLDGHGGAPVPIPAGGRTPLVVLL
jgi:hypothetical protein